MKCAVRRVRSGAVVSITVATVLLAGSPAALSQEAASPAQEVEATSRLPGPWEQMFALSAYAVGWEGAYGGLGIGGRLRFEVVEGSFGVEAFGEHLMVEASGGIRHDHPIGFNLYIPIAIGESVRLRPLLGACTVFSFIEPTSKHTKRTDDILFGVHGGLGVEVAIDHDLSFFADAQGIAYVGHDRTYGGWTANVSEDLSMTGVVQVTAGLQVHLDI